MPKNSFCSSIKLKAAIILLLAAFGVKSYPPAKYRFVLFYPRSQLATQPSPAAYCARGTGGVAAPAPGPEVTAVALRVGAAPVVVFPIAGHRAGSGGVLRARSGGRPPSGPLRSAQPLRPSPRASPLPSLTPSLSRTFSICSARPPWTVEHGAPGRKLYSIPTVTTSSIPAPARALQHPGGSAWAPSRRRHEIHLGDFQWCGPAGADAWPWPTQDPVAALLGAGVRPWLAWDPPAAVPRRGIRCGLAQSPAVASALVRGPAPVRCTPPVPIEAAGSIRTDCIRKGQEEGADKRGHQ